MIETIFPVSRLALPCALLYGEMWICGADDVPVLQQQGGVLSDGAAAFRRRAHDLLLQVHQVQAAVEGVVLTGVFKQNFLFRRFFVCLFVLLWVGVYAKFRFTVRFSKKSDMCWCCVLVSASLSHVFV